MRYVYFVSYMFITNGGNMGFGNEVEVGMFQEIKTGDQVKAIAGVLFEQNAALFSDRPTILNFQLLRVEDES